MTDLNLEFNYPEFILPAINSNKHFVVVPAGRQTGKTYNFAQWIIRETMRLNCPSLWVDTVHTNIDKYIERYFKPLLKPISSYCDWNAQKKILKLPCGYIDFGSAQKPENLEGFNYKRAVLNEAGHILKKDSLWHNTIMPMIKAEDNQTRIIGTPKGQNLFYELFLRGLAKDPEYESFQYTVYDSPYWSAKQIEDVRRKTPELIWKQEYMASFEAFAGMIYPDFKEEIHCKASPERKVTDIFFVSLDPGWEHPTACILAKEDLEGNLFVIDEFRESHLHVGDISRYLQSMLVRNGLKEEDIEMFIIDPSGRKTDQTSGQSILFQLQEEGWGFVPANNDLMPGISRVTRMIRENRLFIDKNRCPLLVEEIKNYHWKEFNDGSYGMDPTPYKIGDDLVDTVRYLCMARPDYFEHPKVNMYGELEKEEEEEDVDINDTIDEMMSGDNLI